MASTGQKISLELTQTVLGTAANQTVLDLADAILDKRPDAGLETIHRALDAGTDARLLARQIVDYLRTLLLVKLGNEAQADLAADTRAQVKRHAEALTAPEILRMTRLFNAAAADLRGSWQPSLSLELALAEAIEEPLSAGKLAAEGGERPPETRTRPEVPPRRAGQSFQAKPAEISHPNPAPPAASVPENKPITGAVSLDQVAKAWRQVRAIVRQQNPALEALLNSCKLLEVKEGVLVLGFASEVLRSKMDAPGQLDATRKVIAEVLGVELQIRCVVSNARQTAPPDVKQDGMVAAVLEAGGEIVDIQE
jgi:DNA polymerase-3 subunit gamma/tau